MINHYVYDVDRETVLDKINLQDNTGKKASIAIANIKNQISKLKDEDNTITY